VLDDVHWVDGPVRFDLKKKGHLAIIPHWRRVGGLAESTFRPDTRELQ
jgi:hypothetical protein